MAVFSYTHYIEFPLKLVACWDWFPSTSTEWKILLNSTYLCLVLFVLLNVPVMLLVNIYTECSNVMEKFSDSLPYVASLFIVCYFALYRRELYELTSFMDNNFKFHSARGLSNMTMEKSYNSAKNFAYTYTACSLGSSTMYAVVPFIIHLWTKVPMQGWFYMDVFKTPLLEITFIRQLLAQTFMGLALGQLGVFFASNAILLCGQLDLVCCSLRNARFTALLQNGVSHVHLAPYEKDILNDEKHYYIYNKSETKDSLYHFDFKTSNVFTERKSYYDIYSPEFDAATEETLKKCARMCQVIVLYKERFERFVSPLLVVRVVQVTLYLCTLLYTASKKFDMVTVEYLLAVALDIFIYCYYGNQIIIQADRVTTSAYQSFWHTMGVRPRKLLLNILLANKRPMTMRAGRFLPMDLTTYVTIIKTSFSYYTLLANVNEHK